MLSLVHGEQRWSAAELDAWATEIASTLGVGQGARVGVTSPNSPELVALWLACRKLGAALVPFNTRLTEAELAPMRAAARLDSTYISSIHPERRHAVPKSKDGASLVAAALFTSGTTGTPKAVELTWANFDANARASAANLPASPRDRWLLCMPMFHVGALALIHRAHVAGCTVVMESFDAPRINALIDRGELTHASLVSTMLQRLLDDRGDRKVPATMKAILIGGGPVTAPLLAKARALGLPVLQTYGLTEACSQVCTERLDDADGETSGPPLPGVELQIIDGEICVRGEMVAGEKGRWLHTGDLGALDARGRLVVHSRRVDLIVTGGENVSPLEIERVLGGHPSVREVAVVPRADAQWGQVPVAAVAFHGAPASDETLAAFCRQSLAGFKIPKAFVAVPELPRNAMGKVDRRALQAIISSVSASQPPPASRSS